jgi:hypothetical protein
MEIPVSSTLGFIGIVLFGFGLSLVLAGFDIFTIQQVSVRKGPKTWGLGIGIVILGIVLLFPEISPTITNSNNTATQMMQRNEVSQPTEEIINTQEEVNGDATWKPVTIKIPNDGHWTQPTDTSFFATGDKTDAFAWSEEIIEGDFTLHMDVESDFGNYR